MTIFQTYGHFKEFSWQISSDLSFSATTLLSHGHKIKNKVLILWLLQYELHNILLSKSILFIHFSLFMWFYRILIYVICAEIVQYVLRLSAAHVWTRPLNQTPSEANSKQTDVHFCCVWFGVGLFLPLYWGCLGQNVQSLRSAVSDSTWTFTQRCTQTLTNNQVYITPTFTAVQTERSFI